MSTPGLCNAGEQTQCHVHAKPTLPAELHPQGPDWMIFCVCVCAYEREKKRERTLVFLYVF